MAKEVYVGNLPYSVTDEELMQHFSAQGAASASVVKDRASGRSRGFGFVKFDEDDAADKAVEALNGQDMGGRPLTVREARPRQES